MTKLDSLSPEQRRVMLATAAGWKLVPHQWTNSYNNTNVNGWKAQNPHGLLSRTAWADHERAWKECGAPEYDTDLNACHALEAKLTDEQCKVYLAHLETIHASDVYESNGDLECPADNYWFHASASQRASALILTLVEGVKL